MSFRRRLVLGALIVVSVMVLAVVLIANRRLEVRLFEQLAGQLEQEARFVATQWNAAADPDMLADAAGEALGHRVTLIAPDGRVLGDSEFDGDALLRLENHSDRPEVRAALGELTGVARRSSPSIDTEQLYVAVAAPFGVARVSIATGRVQAIAAGARRDVAIAGLIALLIAMALALAFARSVTRPLVELRDAARSLADGDLTQRPTLSAPGELGDLATALNGMGRQLAARLEALEGEDALLGAVVESLGEGVVAVDAARRVVRINESARRLLGVAAPLPFPADDLPRDPALRAALDDALRGTPTHGSDIEVDDRTLALTARPLSIRGGGAVLAFFDLTHIRRLEVVRRDFVANVSHELRTPLTVIGGFAETLADDDVPAGERRQFAEAIRANAQRMQRIVDDLLDLSRIESGGWRPNPIVIEFLPLAGDVVAAAERVAIAKGVHVEVDVSDDARTGYADVTALRQILANLVDNAVRYTKSGGTIVIRARRDRASTRLEVRDDGVGIPPEHLPRIFERFYRADRGRARESGGTGLGLAIVRHLAEAHGGRVEAESVVGKGTTIGVILPDRPPEGR
ncbi:MAG: ATP-binding protein [Gemmatimonadaceae bacterium]